VLVTDDLAMRALSGSPGELALAALAAGCDIALFCPGEAEPTVSLLAACPEIAPGAAVRLAAAATLARWRRLVLDGPALADERDRLLA
jgi:beta-N-acetylhexosaminidase